jgi:tol-pal system protein YbgF
MTLRALLLFGLLLSFPSYAGLFSDEDARRDIGEVQTQVETLTLRISTLEEAAKNQGLLDLLTQIQGLSAEITKLRGQIEVINNEVVAAQKRQKDMYIDLDSRLRNLEQAAEPKVVEPKAPEPITVEPKVAEPANPAAQPKGKRNASTKTGNKKPAEGGSNESRVYDEAYGLFKAGNYQGAIVAFLDFIKAYPSSNHAPSAQYWIGNSFFAMREYKNAITSQNKLISNYPDSPKVPDAMLNIASAKIELGEKAQARKTLQEIITKFPISDAAENAKRRLANIN